MAVSWPKWRWTMTRRVDPEERTAALVASVFLVVRAGWMVCAMYHKRTFDALGSVLAISCSFLKNIWELTIKNPARRTWDFFVNMNEPQTASFFALERLSIHSGPLHLPSHHHQVTELLLEVVRVADSNGLKLPREFALLVKQAPVASGC